jgi:ATP-dependent DNA helicase RecG
MDVSKLLAEREGQKLEFKESFGREALETIGAFANAEGGQLLIGVDDNGQVTGITIGRNTLEEWAQKMQFKIQPRCLPSLNSQVHKGRTIVVIGVERTDTPVSVDGRFMKRVGPSNQLMSTEEIRERFFRSREFSWDSGEEETATIADLDEEKLMAFVKALRKVGRRPVPADDDLASVLGKLKMIENGKPVRAAILLFGKNAQRFYPSAYIKAGRFKSETLIVDDKRFEGTLFEQIEDAMSWFKERLETRFVIGKPRKGSEESPGGLARREDVWEYPLEALREAVVNAICHRKYWSGATTTIRLYDDRVAVWNPGSLPAELTPEDLLRAHESRPQNRLIAEAFFNVSVIEQWGSGTLRIAGALEAQGLLPPQFDVSSSLDTFKVIMYAGERYGTRTLLALGLNERQLKAVSYLKSGDSLTNAQYQELFESSKATASRDLTELVMKGLITRAGKTGKGTVYRLAEGLSGS